LSDLREPGRFRSWFYAVLLSVHRNRSRRAFWRRFLSLEGETARGFEPAVEPATPGREERRRAGRVSRALATLPAVQKEAVVLFTLEDFSIEEIAAAQKVSISAVKSRLQRGRERLRRFYEREGLGAPAPSVAVRSRSFGEGSAP
jgi:RNA polymerase sigma-70 factor, ECF subfamily